jgi:membrane associated rhomboid family serine protease
VDCGIEVATHRGVSQFFYGWTRLTMKALVVFVIAYCVSVSVWKFFYGSGQWMDAYAVSTALWSEQQWYRLALGPFAHLSLLHLWLNLYALYYYFWVQHSKDSTRNAWLMSAFILAIPLAALMFSWCTAEGNSVGISGGLLAILGFLLVVDKSREVSNCLILTFLAGSLMPDVIDSISHATGFAVGFFTGTLYLKQDGQLPRRAESEAQVE